MPLMADEPYPLQANSQLSPMLHTSNRPVSGKLLFFSASLSNFGGSVTPSSVRTQVPQCIPIALLHLVSLNMLTLS